jgi:hypothetical protein
MWLLISEEELFIRPPVKKNPGKNVSKYFYNDVECGKVFGVTLFYGTGMVL